MEAFESILMDALRQDGYWCVGNYRVAWPSLDHKVRAHASKSEPRVEIDVLAYRPTTDRLYVVECKSFQESGGADLGEVLRPKKGRLRYKLFQIEERWAVVSGVLRDQLLKAGLIRQDTTIERGLAFSAIRQTKNVQQDAEAIRAKGWWLIEPSWIAEQIEHALKSGYVNSEPLVLAKMMRSIPPTHG